MNIEWSELALERVQDLSFHREPHDAEAARIWVTALFEAVSELATHPFRGRIVPEVGREEVRELVWRKHRIVYRVRQDRLSILTVIHGRQELIPGDLL